MKFSLRQVLLVTLAIPVFISCNTYNTKLSAYYKQVEEGHYTKAERLLYTNSFMQRGRNILLSYMEKGKLFHLEGRYDSSNRYFNLADHYIEDHRSTVGDIVKANLVNPMMQNYLGEDHERFMIHYYKALNYLYLGLPDDAIVEARRITLSSNAQQDKFKSGVRRYTMDAFALNLQGLLYEATGDFNNAFISYRNAIDIYLKDSSHFYYGVKLPDQLMQDFLKTAGYMGFYEEAARYKKLFNLETFDSVSVSSSTGGELVVFIEQGWAPVKQEQNYLLTKDENGVNGFYFTDAQGNAVAVPFDYYNYTGYNNNDPRLSFFRVFRVAIPYYQVRSPVAVSTVVKVDSVEYKAEPVQDINVLAVSILKERLFKELASAIGRQIVKQLVEKGTQAAAKEIAKDNSKEKDAKKKDDNAEAIGLAAGFLMNMINTATEKADTRNWQTLPAFIQYIRVPLKPGENVITLQNGGIEQTIRVSGGKSKLQFYNWCTEIKK